MSTPDDAASTPRTAVSRTMDPTMTTAPQTPPTHPTGLDPRLVRAWGWTALAVLAGAATAVVVALPFYPRDDTSGWAELGWAIYTGLGAIVLGLLAGAVTLWLRLRTARAPDAGQVAVAFLPTAVLLGALTAGLGALLAPPLAWWLVRGLHRPAEPGWGTATDDPVDRLTATGAWPRLVLAVVVTWLGTWWVLGRAGHRLGGEVHGDLLTFAACLPVLVLVPVALLVRRAWWLALALAAAGMLLTWLAVPGATDSAHLTAERLQHEVEAVGVPDGSTQQGLEVGGRSDGVESYGYELPVIAVGADTPVPGGLVDGNPATTNQGTPRGQQVAAEWAQRLDDAGWERTPPDQVVDVWLTPAVTTFVGRAGTQVFELGPWVTAWVVPVGDGAVLYVFTRP